MRSFKRISAIVLVVAMLFSLITVSSFAAENNFKVSYKITNAVTGSEITSETGVKAGTEVNIDIMFSENEYNSIFAYFVAPVNLDSSKISVSDTTKFKAVLGASKLATDKLTIETDKFTSTKQVIASVKMTIPETSETTLKLLEFDAETSDAQKPDFNSYTNESSDASVKVIPTFTAKTAKPFKAGVETSEVTVGLDTDKDTALNGITATVYGTDTAKEVESNYAISWKESTPAYNPKVAGSYEFKGDVVIDGNGAATATTLTDAITVTVKVDKINVADDATIAAVENLQYQKTENDGTVAEATILADAAKRKTVKATKGEYSTDLELSNWATSGATKTLDSKTLTTYDETTKAPKANFVTITADATAKSDDKNFKGTKQVTFYAVVVPAEISGSKFSVDNAAQYGNAKVAFTIPGAEVNGKKVSAYMYTKLTTDGKIDETSLVANSKVETEEITAEVSSEKGATPVTYKDYTGSLQFASFDSLGLKTNDKFYVVLKVDTATVKNGEDMYVESYVLPESNRRPNNGGGNSGGTVVVKKHDVKVTEGTNGTATVDKEAKVGDTVKVDVKPNEGYKVKEIIVKTADGKTVEVDQKNRTFVMPDGDVTVEVVYEEGTDEPTVADGKFTDVPDTFWAAADIYTLKEAGIINGKSDKEFDPEGKVTRAEFTKMIVNLFGVKASQNTVAFTDCKADDWFTPFVAAAVEAGYVKGITDTEFAPDKTITREEACTILGRAYAKTSDKALNFTDASGISDFATAYVALLVDMGYVNGYEDGTFLPKNEITRAEAAKIIASAFRAAEKAKTEVTEDKTEAKNNADADVKADDKTDAKADDKTEVKADDKTDAKADAKTDAKADNGETPEK